MARTTLPFHFEASQMIEQGRTTRAAIEDIKSWLQTTSLPWIQDELITLFLISCRNDATAAKSAIEAYFRLKNQSPEMFNGRDIDDANLKRASSVMAFCTVPVTANLAIQFYKLVDANYRNFNLLDSLKIAGMLVDITLNSNPPDEIVLVSDMKDSTLMHLTRMNLQALKTFMEFVQEAQPLRIRAIHLVNVNYVMMKALAIVKRFINSELLSIMETHPSGVDLGTILNVPNSCLPKDYGGDLPSLKVLNRRTIIQLRKLKPFFDTEEMIRNEQI